jgi:porphobilinogen synthase
MSLYPDVRLRRLRRTPALRNMFDMPAPGPEKFMWPVFLKEGRGLREPIDAMPGQSRMSVDVLLPELERVTAMGINSILLFGLVDTPRKNATGSAACDPRGAVPQAIRKIRKKFPNLVIASDVCVCAYTTHGHCGPLQECGAVDNDAANAVLAKMAVTHAAAGADIVAPSAMMDGQVAAIRQALDDKKHTDTLLMSYSTKFASSMYGPFRAAEESAPQKGDRRGYQTSAGDLRQALRESDFDEAEGADLLMLKPSLFYLDILARLRDRTDLPIAAYNVSGEYSMLIAAAERGWGDLHAMVRESTLALARAGADLIISYWANQYDTIWGKQSRG